MSIYTELDPNLQNSTPSYIKQNTKLVADFKTSLEKRLLRFSSAKLGKGQSLMAIRTKKSRFKALSFHFSTYKKHPSFMSTLWFPTAISFVYFQFVDRP